MSTETRPRRYIPKFEGAIEGYVVNFLRTNFWRVQGSMEFQDCMQEAHWLFLKLADRYGVLDTPQHFMGLFKRSWHNHFTNLANLDTKLRVEVSDSSFADDDEGLSYLGLVERLVGDTDCGGYLLVMLQQAPADVKTVISFFALAPQDLVDSAFGAWRTSKRKKEGGNNMLCQLLGFKPGTDALGRVEAYFKTT